MSSLIADSRTICVACHHDQWRFVREGFDLYRPNAGIVKLGKCEVCGHVAQIPPPSAKELQEAYSVPYGCYRPAWKHRGWPLWKILRVITTWRRVKRLKRYGRGNRLLEVGSGAGDFLYAALRAGWVVSAVEYNEVCVRELNAEKGIDIRPGELMPGVWEADSFDVAALWAVVEHLSDPLATLRDVSAYLKPGGIALIQVPTAYSTYLGKQFGSYWHMLDLPRHLNFFTRSSLAELCQQAGLTLITFETSAIDTAYCYLSSVVNLTSHSRNKIWRYAQLIGIGALLLIWPIPYMAVRALFGYGTEAFAVAVKS